MVDVTKDSQSVEVANAYESVMTCLTRITPNLVPRGILVIDDYEAWSGWRAVNEFFDGKENESLLSGDDK